MSTILLGQIAHARSGDKGNHANIGVVAYTRLATIFLAAELTADRVANFFAGLKVSKVDSLQTPQAGRVKLCIAQCAGRRR